MQFLVGREDFGARVGLRLRGTDSGKAGGGGMGAQGGGIGSQGGRSLA